MGRNDPDLLLMFAVDRPTLLKSLEQLRRRLCQYGPNAERCDCKFANDGIRPRAIGQGEACGCAEIEQCIRMFTVMTDGTFLRTARAGVNQRGTRAERDADR